MSPTAVSPLRFDAVLVGGGLQNGLIALAFAAERPAARIAIVERGDRIGGEHTWCFHAADVPAAARRFVDPLIEFRWTGYDVAFPGLRRELTSPYFGLSSERFRRVVVAAVSASPANAILLGAEAAEVGARRVLLRDGRVLEAPLVVDSRGPEVEPAYGRAGFQKFVGRELVLRAPHGLERPIVMDATVPQRDGFRFVYVLPLAPDRVLVEDTYFSDSSRLEREPVAAEVDAYARGRGWSVSRVAREEHGVLPMPWAAPDGRARDDEPLRGGYRGGWLHPATGYSFPVAVRVAAHIAGASDGDAVAALAPLARELEPQLRFARLLNRLLFRWYPPEQRTHVFERFYRLPEDLIRRFYALRMTTRDRMRLLVGRPPRGFSVRARMTASERFADATSV